MNGQTDFTAKVEPEDFKNTLFLAMELSRSTWLVATFAPRLGDKISVHAIPGGDLKGRVRRIMIIALARKLVIALWRYVETGKVPTGAIVTT
ncbi:hypothetical protein [Bradyrhizobium sp.]